MTGSRARRSSTSYASTVSDPVKATTALPVRGGAMNDFLGLGCLQPADASGGQAIVQAHTAPDCIGRSAAVRRVLARGNRCCSSPSLAGCWTRSHTRRHWTRRWVGRWSASPSGGSERNIDSMMICLPTNPHRAQVARERGVGYTTSLFHVCLTICLTSVVAVAVRQTQTEGGFPAAAGDQL